MRLVAIFAAALLGALPAAAQERAPDPVPIEEWSLERISAMGQAIFRQDQAAWVSTETLLAHLADAPPPGDMAGWIVVDEGDAQRVRYLRRKGEDLRAAFDILVRNGRADPVRVVDEPLSEPEMAQVRARMTAGENIGRLRCSQQMNAVAVVDPDSDEWLVWLLTPMPDDGKIPVGGHYRFRISSDGKQVVRRDQLSNACFFAERPPAGQRENAMLFYTQIVSQTPVETHVFLSIQNQITLVIVAGERFYSVGGARIADITDRVRQQ